MSQALYRRYRPMTFTDVYGQEHVKRTLQNQLAAGNQVHAYLFAGPRGIGKTTIARLLAQSLNCQNRAEGVSDACGTCSHCEAFLDGRAVDIVEIDAASHTGVDHVREHIIESSRFTPAQGAYKVFIIDEVHMLSTSAFNALLKTIEEPPAHVVFILATTELHKIPATILSRCQRFDFQRIAPDAMRERLTWIGEQEGVGIDDDVLGIVVRLSEGCLRDAESLLGQLLTTGEKQITMDVAQTVLPKTATQEVAAYLEALVSGNAQVALQTVQAYVDQGGSMKYFVNECIALTRSLLLWKADASVQKLYAQSLRERLAELVQKTTTDHIVVLLDAMLKIKSRPLPEAFPQLPLEILAMQYDSGKHQVTDVYTAIDGDSSASDSVPKESPKQESKSESIVNVEVQPEAQQDAGIVDESKIQEVTNEEEQVAKAENQDEAAADAGDSINVEDLTDKWGRCCEHVARQNVALPLVLQKATPVRVEGDTVVIGFEHSFHHETISSSKNTELLRSAIEAVMQVPVKIKCILTTEEEEGRLSDIAAAFGGSVV